MASSSALRRAAAASRWASSSASAALIAADNCDTSDVNAVSSGVGGRCTLRGASCASWSSCSFTAAAAPRWEYQLSKLSCRILRTVARTLALMAALGSAEGAWAPPAGPGAASAALAASAMR